MGPILFLLYINDLTDLNILGKFTLFADDTTLLWHCPDIVSLIEAMTADLRIIYQWFSSNLLSLNTQKTKLMSFRCVLNTIFVADLPVESVEQAKFLGLVIDRNLKFGKHIIALCQKLSSGNYAVRVATQELGAGFGKTVYFALVESHLRYGICFWGTASNSRMQTLQEQSILSFIHVVHYL